MENGIAVNLATSSIQVLSRSLTTLNHTHHTPLPHTGQLIVSLSLLSFFADLAISNACNAFLACDRLVALMPVLSRFIRRIRYRSKSSLLTHHLPLKNILHSPRCLALFAQRNKVIYGTWYVWPASISDIQRDGFILFPLEGLRVRCV